MRKQFFSTFVCFFIGILLFPFGNFTYGRPLYQEELASSVSSEDTLADCSDFSSPEEEKISLLPKRGAPTTKKKTFLLSSSFLQSILDALPQLFTKKKEDYTQNFSFSPSMERENGVIFSGKLVSHCNRGIIPSKLLPSPPVLDFPEVIIRQEEETSPSTFLKKCSSLLPLIPTATFSGFLGISKTEEFLALAKTKKSAPLILPSPEEKKKKVEEQLPIFFSIDSPPMSTSPLALDASPVSLPQKISSPLLKPPKSSLVSLPLFAEYFFTSIPPLDLTALKEKEIPFQPRPALEKERFLFSLRPTLNFPELKKEPSLSSIVPATTTTPLLLPRKKIDLSSTKCAQFVPQALTQIKNVIYRKLSDFAYSRDNDSTPPLNNPSSEIQYSSPYDRAYLSRSESPHHSPNLTVHNIGNKKGRKKERNKLKERNCFPYAEIPPSLPPFATKTLPSFSPSIPNTHELSFPFPLKSQFKFQLFKQKRKTILPPLLAFQPSLFEFPVQKNFFSKKETSYSATARKIAPSIEQLGDLPPPVDKEVTLSLEQKLPSLLLVFSSPKGKFSLYPPRELLPREKWKKEGLLLARKFSPHLEERKQTSYFPPLRASSLLHLFASSTKGEKAAFFNSSSTDLFLLNPLEKSSFKKYSQPKMNEIALFSSPLSSPAQEEKRALSLWNPQIESFPSLTTSLEGQKATVSIETPKQLVSFSTPKVSPFPLETIEASPTKEVWQSSALLMKPPSSLPFLKNKTSSPIKRHFYPKDLEELVHFEELEALTKGKNLFPNTKNVLSAGPAPSEDKEEAISLPSPDLSLTPPKDPELGKEWINHYVKKEERKEPQFPLLAPPLTDLPSREEIRSINEDKRLSEQFLTQVTSPTGLETIGFENLFETKVSYVQKEGSNGYFFCCKIKPNPKLHFVSPKQNYIFLIDASGSIKKNRYDTFREGVNRSLDYLKEEDSFNILIADSEVHPMHGYSILWNEKNLKKGKTFLAEKQFRGYFANYNTFDLLSQVLPYLQKERENVIILLTDGSSLQNLKTHRETLKELIKQNKQGISFSLYTAASGQKNNLAMLEVLSRFNGGELMYSQTNTAFPRKFARFIKHMESFIAKEIRLNTLFTVPNDKIEFYPNLVSLPSLYFDEPYTIYGTIDELKEFDLLLQARSGEHWLNIKQTISFEKAEKGGHSLRRKCALQQAYTCYDYYLSKEDPFFLKEAEKLLNPYLIDSPIR